MTLSLSFTALPLFANWKAFDEGKDWVWGYEVGLYSDADIYGPAELTFGPYTIINPHPEGGRYTNEPRIYARIYTYIDELTSLYGFLPLDDETEDSRFHGGDLDDELAALLSLQMGVRIRVGPCFREFVRGGNPEGEPIVFGERNVPVLPPLRTNPVVPRLVGKVDMRTVGIYEWVRGLSSETVTTILRAARQFQNALDLVDSEPALAWLLFVTAIETVAASYAKEQLDAEAEIRRIYPKMVKILEDAGSGRLVPEIAPHLAHITGATQKFIRFLVDFAPGPPRRRPGRDSELDYSSENLRKVFRKIYAYRSEALHTGKPFPLPMCDPPTWFESPPVYVEVPPTATATLGSSWTRYDAPILLHTFERITRHALLKWLERTRDSQTPRE